MQVPATSNYPAVRVLIAQAADGEAKVLAAALKRAARGGFEVAAERPDCALVVTDDPRAAPAAAELATLGVGVPLIALERDGDGERALCHPAFVGVLPLNAPAGTLVALIGLAVRLREAERRAAASEAQDEAHAQLAALGEVTASVGHELGNLLAILTAWTGQLKTEAARLGPAHARIGDIGAKLDAVGARILRLINGIGLCSRGVGEQAATSYALGELLEHALAITGPKARVRDVQVELAGDVGIQLQGIPGQITQALVTLISDAAQRAAGGRRRSVVISAAVGEDEAELAFEVEGAGAAAGAAASASERILRGIVERHGGQLFEADEGGVRRRVLRLPRGVAEC